VDAATSLHLAFSVKPQFRETSAGSCLHYLVWLTNPDDSFENISLPACTPAGLLAMASWHHHHAGGMDCNNLWPVAAD